MSAAATGASRGRDAGGGVGAGNGATRAGAWVRGRRVMSTEMSDLMQLQR